MALIIKGVEIPVDCLGCDEIVMLSQCPIHLNEPLKYCNGTRHPDCPIIGEIPDKHGDLKDANIIMQWLNLKADNRVPVTVGEIIDFIEKQPTVLEASE